MSARLSNSEAGVWPGSRSLALWLGVVIAFCVQAAFVAEFLDFQFDAPVVRHLDSLFDLDREANVPTWVSAALLIGAGLQALAVSRGEIPHAIRFRKRWVLLGVLFLLLSLDEAARVHERLGLLVVGRPGAETGVLLRNGWVVLYGAAIVPLGLLFLPFVFGLPRRTMLAVMSAGGIYVGGALGIELLESLAQGDGERRASLAMFILTTTQETLEMVGIAVMLVGVQDMRERARLEGVSVV